MLIVASFSSFTFDAIRFLRNFMDFMEIGRNIGPTWRTYFLSEGLGFLSMEAIVAFPVILASFDARQRCIGYAESNKRNKHCPLH
jgi:hypothetical protein